MAVIQDGSVGSTLAKVRTSGQLATVPIPEQGSNYSAGWETPSIAFTTGVVVWDMRNASANLMLIHQVEAHWVEMAIATASATGLRASLQLFVGRTYTAQSVTGATALTLTTNNCKLRTSYSTAGAQIGFANVAGGITGGTITGEDATPLAQSAQGAQDPSVTAAAAPGGNQHRSGNTPLIWTPNPWGGPIVLAQNEGIRIRYLVTTAAAVIVSGNVQWTETGATSYP
jgi:hypothetical protein